MSCTYKCVCMYFFFICYKCVYVLYSHTHAKIINIMLKKKKKTISVVVGQVAPSASSPWLRFIYFVYTVMFIIKSHITPLLEFISTIIVFSLLQIVNNMNVLYSYIISRPDNHDVLLNGYAEALTNLCGQYTLRLNWICSKRKQLCFFFYISILYYKINRLPSGGYCARTLGALAQPSPLYNVTKPSGRF